MLLGECVLGPLPRTHQDDLIAHLRLDLETRVGFEIAEGLSGDDFSTFERLKEAAPTKAFLSEKSPLDELVAQAQVTAMRDELIKRRDEIVAVSGAKEATDE